jgi:hypothetical protein
MHGRRGPRRHRTDDADGRAHRTRQRTPQPVSRRYEGRADDDRQQVSDEHRDGGRRRRLRVVARGAEYQMPEELTDGEQTEQARGPAGAGNRGGQRTDGRREDS